MQKSTAKPMRNSFTILYTKITFLSISNLKQKNCPSPKKGKGRFFYRKELSFGDKYEYLVFVAEVFVNINGTVFCG